MKFSGADNLSPFGAGGLNAYAYCNGDPLNLSDPSGHASPWLPFFSVVLGLVGAGAGVMAGFSEGEERNIWIGVAAVSGVLSVGLAGSAMLKGGGRKNKDIFSSNRTDPKTRSAQRAPDVVKPAPGSGGKSTSGKGIKGGGKDRSNEARDISEGLKKFNKLKPQLKPGPNDRKGRSHPLGGDPLYFNVPKPVPAHGQSSRPIHIYDEPSSIRLK